MANDRLFPGGTSDDEGLRCVLDGRIARITLADPERRNPLGLARMRALTALLRRVDDHADAALVVIDAEGPAFSAGHDLTELCGIGTDDAREVFDACVALMQTVRRVRRPVIAAVDGIATAAGCQLVASCDLALASASSTFATPGVRIGLFCSTPMVPLSRAIGAKRAMQMLLTGNPIDAATAADWGLVNAVVPDGSLAEEVASLADDVLRWSPHTIAIGKALFHEQLGRTEDDAYAIAAPIMRDNAVDAVAQEGITAFVEKRSPDWPA